MKHPFSRRPTAHRCVGVVATVALVVAALSGCGVTRGDAADDFTVYIPNSPGGGYDQTGRAAVAAMERNDLTGGDFEINNIIGAGGSVAMSRLMNAEGDDHLLMYMGLGVVGSLYSNGNDVRPQDATPIAKLIEDQEGVLVPADSPFQTFEEFIEAWRADPGSIVVGGGSSVGGPDHLFPMLLAEAAGIDPTEVRYVVYDGGGPLTSALLGNKIQVGFSGLGEFEGQIAGGDLRGLAVSGEERIASEALGDIPTVTEGGVDLVFNNWRGVLAPPGISDEDRQRLIDLVVEMHGTEEWQTAMAENGWIDALQTGDEFTSFLEEEDARVRETLDSLGLVRS
ncbi:tripartite tricarboxylate transporter substrate binding protein [Nocardioides zeae]|uniref:Tripartite tricarboxylate transporter substrate binding protein n=1 Tax=Nocardioides imazamoxiresistens TaxID=3231893 RepID=A0ABU3PQQ2_9ACTN|nr:tripartite tricarboxylate transporter substrate binding protein [Nocardioides zeae]MDT9591547.1 tripartite tricarboxylate transporter substrate binding protein [Nocardioides zeae]